MKVLYDPYENSLGLVRNKQITLAEFSAAIVLHNNREASEYLEKLKKEIAIAKEEKDSRKKLLFGISL